MWYMTKENYRDMRQGKLARVFVPLLENNYTLHLYGSIDIPYNESCAVSTPSQGRHPVQLANRELNRFAYPITPAKQNSGVYSVSCSVMYNDSFEGHTHTLLLKKSLEIIFIQGM